MFLNLPHRFWAAIDASLFWELLTVPGLGVSDFSDNQPCETARLA